MLSFARNERGIRLVSAAVVLLPIVATIVAASRSMALDLTVAAFYGLFALGSFAALMLERAEEKRGRN